MGAFGSVTVGVHLDLERVPVGTATRVLLDGERDAVSGGVEVPPRLRLLQEALNLRLKRPRFDAASC